MQAEEVQRLILAAIPDADVEIAGADDHFEARVVSDQFEGQGPVQRQRMVYAGLKGLIGNEIHALSMRTFTTTEWQKQSKFRVTSE